ncbi:MAG: amidohydrolase family protein [Gemmatimonadales bacterium]
MERFETRQPAVWKGPLAVTSALLLIGCGAADRAPNPTVHRPASADHHVHIRSASAAWFQDSLMSAMGERRPGDTVPSAAVSAADAIAALDSAGVEGALLLSNAYMFGMPEGRLTDDSTRVRAENDYVAAEAARFPERLVGFCSVHPLKSYALREIERCAADPRIGGLKLHLANSDLDLRDEDQLARLGEVFALADRSRLPVLIHMRTREPSYGADDARRFVDRVLSRAPDIPVIVAHMAGWGGYDAGTDAALGVFVDAIQAGRLSERVAFGLGAVVFEPRAAGADTARARAVRDANAKLAGRIRALGLGRVVFATDWPGWPPGAAPVGKIAANRQLIRDALPLEPSELDTVFANVSPIFGWSRAAASDSR